MPRDTGGPAFPRTGFYPDLSVVMPDDFAAAHDTRTEPEAGMTLRDWFAGQALHAAALATVAGAETGLTTEQVTAQAARLAYRFADALLIERAK